MAEQIVRVLVTTAVPDDEDPADVARDIKSQLGGDLGPDVALVDEEGNVTEVSYPE